MRPGQRRHHSIRGPVFPSFVKAGPGPETVRVWKPGTQGLRQRMRQLTRQCQSVLDSRDPEVIRVGEPIFQACAPEAVPRYASLVLMHAALVTSEATGQPWAICASDLLDKFLAARLARLSQPAVDAAIISPPAERI